MNKKLVSMLTCIAITSNLLTVNALAKQSDKTIKNTSIEIKNMVQKDIQDYTVNDLEKIAEIHLNSVGKNYELGTQEYENYFRKYLLSEDTNTKDQKTIKLLRAYAAIYLNKDYLSSSSNGVSIENQTINDIKLLNKKIESESKKGHSRQPRSVNGYNANAAVSYAKKYAESPNKKYYDFSNDGGDCTNFVSQCVNAGGLRQARGSWHYNNVNDRSPAWTGAPQFFNYWVNERGVTNIQGRYKSDIAPQAEAGDVIQYREGTTGIIYHSIFVCGKPDNNYDLYICQHSGKYHGLWTGRGVIDYHGGQETYFELLKFA